MPGPYSGIKGAISLLIGYSSINPFYLGYSSLNLNSTPFYGIPSGATVHVERDVSY